MLHHVLHRWLTLQPSVKHTLEQCSTLCSYFKYLPDKDKAVLQNGQYKKSNEIIGKCKMPRSAGFYCTCHTTVTVMYTNFLRRFQYEGPLVQVLYAAVDDLVRTLMLRFVTTAVCWNENWSRAHEFGCTYLNIWRPLHKLEIYEATKKFVVKNKKGAA